MEVDVEPVVALHLERGLYGRRGDGPVGRTAALHRLGHQTPDFRKLRNGVFVLLGEVAARNPESSVVARKCEFGPLAGDGEVGEPLLFGELVAESHAVVVEAEADEYRTALLRQRRAELVVAVADVAGFAPDGFPGLVERIAFDLVEREAVEHRCCVAQFEAETARTNHCASLEIESIARYALRYLEGERQAPFGRGECLAGKRPACCKQAQQCSEKQGLFHFGLVLG